MKFLEKADDIQLGAIIGLLDLLAAGYLKL